MVNQSGAEGVHVQDSPAEDLQSSPRRRALERLAVGRVTLTNAFFSSFLHRATIEEVEGDVCELESKLDKVSTTHEKHCLIVHLFYCVNWRPSCEWKSCRFVPWPRPSMYIPGQVAFE